MRKLDEFFSKDIDRSLYHYTNIETLIGIAQSRCLWASNIYYMNDSKEIIQAFDILNSILNGFQNSETLNSIEKMFIKQLIEWLSISRTNHYNIFVFSLSQEKSLLSQWRSYTSHGKGISIGFSSAFLRNLMENNDFRMAKCLYETCEHKEILEILIDKLLTSFRQANYSVDSSKAHPSQCFHPFLEQFRGDILQILSIIKHHAFSEECEWRLISRYYPNYTIPEIKFRTGASMLVPYIEIPLGASKPYFEKIILGPSPHQNLSMSALSMFLSNQNLCKTTENCIIPYREW